MDEAQHPPLPENDEDPGAPQLAEEAASSPEEARRANFGDALLDMEAPAFDEALKLEGPPATMALHIASAIGFLAACQTSTPRVRYKLGAKAGGSTTRPGQDFTAIDCSGFVRELVRRHTNPKVAFPDGSVVQHDWVRTQGYAKVAKDEAAAQDGAVRIAFLRPQDTRSGVGHVVLVHKGMTLESRGGVGPDRLQWGSRGWHTSAYVYRLT